MADCPGRTTRPRRSPICLLVKCIKTILLPLFVLIGLAWLGGVPAAAQSSDALLNKLVEKGILTKEEFEAKKSELMKKLV